MNKWRVICVVVVVLATLVIIGSNLIVDQPWAGIPWRRAGSVRQHLLFRRIGMDVVSKRFFVVLAGLIANFLIGSLVIYIFPNRIRKIADVFDKRSPNLPRLLSIGLLGALALVTLGLLSTFSVYTLPASFLLFLCIYLFSLLGIVGLSYYLGQEIMKRAEWRISNPLVSLALGTILVFALVRIPYLGWIILIFLVILGVGVVLSTRFGSGKSWILHSLMEEEV